MDRPLRFPAPPRVRAPFAYSAALGVSALAAFAQFQLRPIVYTTPFILFFFAVTAASWIGGLGPGLFSSAISAVLANFYFLHERAVTSAHSLVINTLFLGVSVIICLLNASLRNRYFEREQLIQKEHQALTRAEAAEKQLTDETFRLLVESVGDYAIFQLDPAGMVVTWNMGAQRIKGYTAEEIIGQHFSKFFTLEDVRLRKPEQELQQALRIGRVEDEGWRVRKNGSRFWANVIITAL